MSAADPDPSLDGMRDPAEYPFRLLVVPEQPTPDATVGVIWLTTPWPIETIQAVRNTLAYGGGIYLMARDRAQLVRQREALEELISELGGRA